MRVLVRFGQTADGASFASVFEVLRLVVVAGGGHAEIRRSGGEMVVEMDLLIDQ